MLTNSAPTQLQNPNPIPAPAALVLETGHIFTGHGLGTPGTIAAELCFNTAMTGYQEILTDPSYAGQIIVFTFPHIGNIGVNAEDIERAEPAAAGLVLRNKPTLPSSWRSDEELDVWLEARGLRGVYGVDTRALTQVIRDHGKAPAATIVVGEPGQAATTFLDGLDIPALQEQAKQGDLSGQELAAGVSRNANEEWNQGRWALQTKYPVIGEANNKKLPLVVAVDYGVKHNILRCLASAGCSVMVVPAKTTAEEILALNPAGVFLSNGPGDPAATAEYTLPEIHKLLDSGKPIFGICLGFQLLGIALGAKTGKMPLGHRGANHPVQDLETGKVEITSQNHGFCVLEESLPAGVIATHKSLFDGTLQGLRCEDKPVFGVQYHPEASPGPQDSYYLFERFVETLG